MKKIIVIGLVIMTLISCEKDDNQRIVLNDDYFPLQIGNQWNFELTGNESIIDKIEINGIDYYKFVNDNGITSYYRKQGDRIFFKSSSADGNEEMKFDLAANVNDTWTYDIGYVTLISRNARITIGNMQIDSCLQFNFHNTDLIDYGYSIWLAPGIGLIQKTCQECYGSAYETLKLKQAVIDNQLIEFE